MRSQCWLALLVLGMSATPAWAQLGMQSASGSTLAPKIFLMGEIHDNEAGHTHRAEQIRNIIKKGLRPAIAFEQFDRESQARLTDAGRDCRDADCVIQRVRGDGWDWQLYKPLIQIALDNKLPMLAVNVSRADAMNIARNGFEAALDAETITAFQLNRALPADLEQSQRQAIEDGHCGALPPAMVGSMVNAQVARDVWMARVIQQQSPGDVILIAGNGHVRRDVGVIRWLAPEQAARTTVSGVIESGKLTPDQRQDKKMLSAQQSEASRYDTVHVVPPQPRPDPCEAFRTPKKR